MKTLSAYLVVMLALSVALSQSAADVLKKYADLRNATGTISQQRGSQCARLVWTSSGVEHDIESCVNITDDNVEQASRAAVKAVIKRADEIK